MYRSSFIQLLLLISLGLGCQVSNSTKEEELQSDAHQIQQKAINWLLEQQAEDGGWHSKTHGILRGGVAYTPFIMDALQTSRTIDLQDHCFAKAFDFLLQQLDQEGAIGQKGAYVVEYPVYATSFLLKIWAMRSVQLDTLLQPHLENYLIDQQFTEKRGLFPEHQAYGAWGFGEQNLPFGEVGHVDLSHTRRVLEALQAVRFDTTHTCWSKAKVFLERLQNDDGGFCSSTFTLSANKADDQTHEMVSYATATADGLLALMSLPDMDITRINAAAKWLLNNEDWDQVSGITPERPGNWEKVLFFYHLAVRAQAYAQLERLGLLPHDNGWRQAVVKLLAAEQSSDGAYSNPWGGPNKEDDPLLATALAVRALNAVLKKE